MEQWLIFAGAVLMLSAGVLLLRSDRRARDATQRAADMEVRAEAAEYAAHVAETEATISYGKGYREATDEINAKRNHESKASYDHGFENGWNAAFTALEDNATIISGGGPEAIKCAAA